jgi:U3 small nucleolar RNA-associated protein 14
VQPWWSNLAPALQLSVLLLRLLHRAGHIHADADHLQELVLREKVSTEEVKQKQLRMRLGMELMQQRRRQQMSVSCRLTSFHRPS